MFLDPEPRNRHRPQSQTEFQGFIPPLASPIDQRIIRKPLVDRSANQPIQRQIEDDDRKPTVRLVRATPSVASIRKEVFGETGDKAALTEKRRSIRLQSLKTAPETGVDIADTKSPIFEFQDIDSSIDGSLQSAVSEDLPPWKRRSLSSGNFSQATTLKGSESTGSAYAGSQRLSSGTTVRDVSTPHDTSLEDLPESAEEAGPHDDTDFSVTTYDYEELIAEHQTIKPISPSIKSHESEVPQADTPRPQSRRQTWSSGSDLMRSSPPAGRSIAPSIPQRTSSIHASTSSFPLIRAPDAAPDAYASTPEVWSASPVQPEASEPAFEDFASSPNFAAFPSSPNFVAYDTSPTRPRSRSHPLRGEASYESIGSRLQCNQTHQRSLAPSASWSSVDPASSHDTLPSLHVPRRRLRMVRGSQSLDMDCESQEQSTFPYSRSTFSGNLSTIASESERSRSRTASHQQNQFSLGNDIVVNDTMGLSGDWSHHPLDDVSLPALPAIHQRTPGSSSEEEPGDMTLGLYREESAMPAPLFRAPSPVYEVFNKRYDGPLPPLPPIPITHDEEDHDTIAELTNPVLKLKRSGYSLRRQRSGTSSGHQRSNSTPVHSRQVSIISCSESDRWSIATSIFPTWAKHYYSGDLALASMSHVSLYSVPSPPTRDGAQNGMRFERFPSQKYQTSINSPPGTAMSDAEFETPQGKFTIPAAFRPRNRPLRVMNVDEHGSPQPQVHRVESDQSLGRDSMAIEPAETLEPTIETYVPSGHPTYGELQDESHSSHALATHRSFKQNRWNDMSLPRPTSNDRLSGIDVPIPHLAPTKRSSAHIDAWRPPSFVESIDLIFKSRGHRQILFFLVGFICPLSWMVGAIMPLPTRPAETFDPEKSVGSFSEDTAAVVQQRHEAGDAAARWKAEKAWRQGLWWRNVNRVMSVVGLFIIGAVIAIAVVTTR